jgi:hypothetical protein
MTTRNFYTTGSQQKGEFPFLWEIQCCKVANVLHTMVCKLGR